MRLIKGENKEQRFKEGKGKIRPESAGGGASGNHTQHADSFLESDPGSDNHRPFRGDDAAC